MLQLNDAVQLIQLNLIPLTFEGKPHDCVNESLAFTRLRPDLESTPIPEAEVAYFVDGSSYSYSRWF